MDRASALQEFHEKIVGITQTAKEKMQGELMSKPDELYGRILQGLDELCYTTTEKQRNEALPSIRYFQVSLLRSYMPLGQLFFWCLPMIAIIFLTEKA